MLRLVYRLLFCFVAEDRGLLLDPSAEETSRARYTAWFSTSRLRRIATRRRGTRHSDLWRALTITLDGLGSDVGRPELGLPGIGGLFRNSASDVVQGCSLGNDALLAAIRHLSVIQPKEGGPRRNIDYQHLGSEELGGIYESLLELVPRHDPSTRAFTLDALAGNERKTTGAHYTPAPLIDCLLEASLDALLDEAEASPDPEGAILSLTVCDPAVGSGHFLVAAARRIAHRLARVRSGDDEPSVTETQAAVRDVIAHCVYGIDINPMAVELCKVSLWLEAMEPGKPLGFLDHHIVNGNGLIGATPRLLAEGVPDAAFTAIEGDDKKTVTARRKTNAFQRDRRSQQILDLPLDPAALADPIAVEMAKIERMPEDTVEQVADKAALYSALLEDAATTRARLAADTWCAAFVAVKTPANPSITDDTVRTAGENPAGLTPEQRSEVGDLTRRYQFLHWHLTFPQIFKVDLENGGDLGWAGGFDLILGNPPWDALSPDAKEFFAAYEPSIRFVKKDEQDRIISRLVENRSISDSWSRHRRELFGLVHFIKSSGRYRMFAPGNLGKGDFNVYRMFVETALTATHGSGWAAQVTPSGLYNGANAAAIRNELFERCRVEVIAGLINTAGKWFPGVDQTTRFAMYSAQRGGATVDFAAGFGISDEVGLAGLKSQPVRISVETIRNQSADSLAVSEVSVGPDASVMAKVYASCPPFGKLVSGAPYRRYSAEIHMGNDRDLFNDHEGGLPLLEGRMIDQYDYRAKAYRSGRGRAAVWEPLEFGLPGKEIVPQWRVPEPDIPAKVLDRVWRYRVAFGDVARPDTERSLMATLVPPGVICGHTVPTFTYEEDEWQYLIFLAVANSFTADFLIRKRLTLHVSLSILDSLPMPRMTVDDPIVAQLARQVLPLICTDPDMTKFWNSMSTHGWCEAVSDGRAVPREAHTDVSERAQARAEIDAIVAKHVYDLSRDELAYVLDQFPVLEKRDRKAHGTFATKDRILDWYDRV